jgi:hypothetical protein
VYQTAETSAMGVLAKMMHVSFSPPFHFPPLLLPRHANTNGATTYTHLHSLKFAFDLECLQIMNTMSDRHLTFISARATRVLAISNICLHLGICLARGVAIHHHSISSVLTVKTTYTAHAPHWAAGCLLLRKLLVAFFT